MKSHSLSKRIVLFVVTVALCALGSGYSFAGEKTVGITGNVYDLDKDGHYDFNTSSVGKATSKANTYGTLSIKGNLAGISGKEKFSYDVKEEAISVKYTLNNAAFGKPETDWNITEDNTNVVNGINLDTKIGNGVIIIETSFDGKKWSYDKSVCNALIKGSKAGENLYETQPIQLVNGCYYRITVAYKTKKKLEDKKLLFVNVDNYDFAKHAEVYVFYAENTAEKESGPSPEAKPRKELGEKVKVSLDKGYYTEEEIKGEDPHYGWDLGTFFVNAYTRDAKDDDGNPVFLKNVGDKVTLWFSLKQDIDKLNGKTELSIAEDKNGYDRKYEIQKMNFRRGTLIIRYTDHENMKHDPVIYTNYLEACTRTGANTKVELFEEGDYEVSLDYEIKNSPRKVANVDVVPTYTDYTITFKFSIRNGNCMVFPFDIATGKELSDNAVTENGFRLDLAKSRYLDINVTRKVVKNGVEDTRYNRPAKDGDEYTDDGIYIFEVKNKYTGEKTTKTIYVGEDSKL